jgi:hypothetical protein
VSWYKLEVGYEARNDEPFPTTKSKSGTPSSGTLTALKECLEIRLRSSHPGRSDRSASTNAGLTMSHAAAQWRRRITGTVETIATSNQIVTCRETRR